MDTPITEKALFAQTRVQQALEAGAHCIDADDVREALSELNYWGSDLEKSRAHIKDLETQLFHCRVNAGGSEVLLGGAISIRDRLVDYFRYVEESLPFAKTAEARERGTAIVDGMSWLIREAGNSRLAAQAVKAQRNQLEEELSEARMALDASQGQVSQLEAEAAELRGPADCHPDTTRTEYVCPECQAYERDGHEDGCQVGRMQTWDRDVLRLTGALPGEKSLSDEAARQADGAWLPWPGGDMPEEAAGKPIDIERRDGEIFQSLPAESFRWDHLEMDGDVVFWRVSKKARVGCPECGRQPGGSSACATCAALQMTGVLK